jgi:hypothetical protein
MKSDQLTIIKDRAVPTSYGGVLYKTHHNRSGPTRQSGVAALQGNNHDDQRENGVNDSNSMDGASNKASNSSSAPVRPNAGAVIASLVAFVSFWPLLALIRYWTEHYEFDPDTYLALKTMLEQPQQQEEYTITVLPPLTPAEQLVGILVGPPNK